MRVPVGGLVHVIGARILVRSSPGQGTTITVRAGRAGRSREEGNL